MLQLVWAQVSVDIIAATSFGLGGFERDLPVSTVPSTPFLMRRSDQGQPTLAVLVNADHVPLARSFFDDFVLRLAVLVRLQTEFVGPALELQCFPLVLKPPDLIFDLAVRTMTFWHDDCQRSTNVVGLFDALFKELTPGWR